MRQLPSSKVGTRCVRRQATDLPGRRPPGPCSPLRWQPLPQTPDQSRPPEAEWNSTCGALPVVVTVPCPETVCRRTGPDASSIRVSPEMVWTSVLATPETLTSPDIVRIRTSPMRCRHVAGHRGEVQAAATRKLHAQLSAAQRAPPPERRLDAVAESEQRDVLRGHLGHRDRDLPLVARNHLAVSGLGAHLEGDGSFDGEGRGAAAPRLRGGF